MDGERVKASGWGQFGERLAKLLEVKSLVTLTLTAAMVGLLFSPRELPQEMVALFSGVYGSVVTYFFTRKGDGGGGAGADAPLCA